MKSSRARVFNDENVALMRAMAREGQPASEIARAIGSTKGSVSASASRLKIKLRSNRVFDDEAVNMMRAMAREGKSFSQVATKIGSTTASVRTVAYKLGIPFRMSGRGERWQTLVPRSARGD
jgi:hypothetical protein